MRDRLASGGRAFRVAVPGWPARLLGCVVAEVAAGQGDEDVFQADVPGGQAGQRPVLALELDRAGRGWPGAARRRSGR